jgi:pimeloyl-ACP methyl ester carboxylesterase
MSSEKNKNQIILQHGWGLSSSCWNGWKQQLSNDFSVLTPDRGYFGNKNIITRFESENKKILVSHSFGLLLFPESLLRQADYLIIISGFADFHTEDKKEKRRSSMLIKFMKKKLLLTPEKLLFDFYNGHDLRGDFDKYPDTDLLSHDLTAIDTLQADWENIKKVKNILILHGKQDMVVPYSKGLSLHENLKQSRFEGIDDADHALPFTHKDRLISIVTDFILS